MQNNNILKIQRLSIENFRGISHLNLDISGQNLALIGGPGAGKTSVLEGLALIFSDLIEKATQKQIRSNTLLTPGCIHNGAAELVVEGQFSFGNEDGLNYAVSYRKERAGRRERKEMARRLSELCVDDSAEIPILAYYSANRAVLSIPLCGKDQNKLGKTAAYQKALGQTDFGAFFEWFRNQEDTERQESIVRRDKDYRDSGLEAVRASIHAILPELSDLRVKYSPLRMHCRKSGQDYTIGQLSDGERCLLALFGDIARRLSLANPDSENPLLGGGIVLIDEVELHLHPKLQRKVVSVLRQTFPNVQLILTTHSPQVLGELGKDFKIISLESAEVGFGYSEWNPAYYDSNFVLEYLMKTPSVNPMVSTLEAQALATAAKKEFGQATEILSQLKTLTNRTSTVITEVEMTILKSKFKK